MWKASGSYRPENFVIEKCSVDRESGAHTITNREGVLFEESKILIKDDCPVTEEEYRRYYSSFDRTVSLILDCKIPRKWYNFI